MLSGQNCSVFERQLRLVGSAENITLGTRDCDSRGFSFDGIVVAPIISTYWGPYSESAGSNHWGGKEKISMGTICPRVPFSRHISPFSTICSRPLTYHSASLLRGACLALLGRLLRPSKGVLPGDWAVPCLVSREEGRVDGTRLIMMTGMTWAVCMNAPQWGREIIDGAPEWVGQVASGGPADWVKDVAKEFRKERTAPVRIVLLDPITDKQLSCKDNFGGWMRRSDTAKLDKHETASACFRDPGYVRYTVRMQSALPSGEVNVPGW